MSKTNINHNDSYNSSSIRIITDEPSLEVDALGFDSYSQKFAEIIINSKPRFAIGIFGDWGTGKTTLMKMIQKKLHNRDNILVVWFDAWKYEKEKHLAILPFIRTIQIELEDKLSKEFTTIDNDTTTKLRKKWNGVGKGLEKTFNAFVGATNLNLALGNYISTDTKLSTFKDILKSDSSFEIDGETIFYHHKHISEYLIDAINKLRSPDLGGDLNRIVVFIDDLDRCSPDKAIEVLESLKTFFDIEGFVYVIGMDSKSINSIVRKKYGDNSHIKGLEYMEKIVQLPFQIPNWKEGWDEDTISKSIETIISTKLAGKDIVIDGKNLVEELNKKSHLISKAVRKNLREAKRFINNVILAKAVYNENIDELIAVQALIFRYEWHKFLELISVDEKRKHFFEEYDESLKNRIKKIVNGEEDWATFSTDESLKKQFHFIDNLNIYRELTIQGEELTSFLDISRTILMNIEEMGKIRRTLHLTRIRYTTKEEDEGSTQVYNLLYTWLSRFDYNKIIPLEEIISFEKEFLSGVHLWVDNIYSKEASLNYSPIRQIAITKLRDHIAELKQAHSMESVDDKENIILEKQRQIKETLRLIDQKMWP